MNPLVLKMLDGIKAGYYTRKALGQAIFEDQKERFETDANTSVELELVTKLKSLSEIDLFDLLLGMHFFKLIIALQATPEYFEPLRCHYRKPTTFVGKLIESLKDWWDDC